MTVRPFVCGLLIVLACAVLSTHAQFPKVCAHNATTEDGVCCPTPSGFAEPCGGSGRGSCKLIPDNQDDYSRLQSEFEHDDRINWPHRFFHYACSCEGNFFGYMCHECVFGYRGKNCNIKHRATRKDATKLTKAEQDQFRRVVDHSKKVPSDYVVLTNVFDQDPSTKATFTDVSVYDFIVFIHQYSSRHTVLRDSNNKPTRKCQIDYDATPLIDFGHKGSAFPTWHRALMLFWERELQKASGENDFTFPYWDWTDMGDNCNVCINELVGATNLSDPDGRLDTRSPFSNWQILCQFPSLENHFCYFCDPAEPGTPLTRKRSSFVTLPEQSQLDYALSLPQYDTPPYNSSSSKESFRNVLFGSAGEHGLLEDTGVFQLHAQGHASFTGAFGSVPLSVNDPMFILHHTFVDKILEMWIRKYEPELYEMPERGAPPGHNRNAYLAPFFPVLINSDFFVDSRQLGYDYDDMVESAQPASLHSQSMNANASEMKGHSNMSTWIVSTVLGVLVLAGIVVTAVLIIKKKRQLPQDLVETTPLLNSDEGA